MSRKTVISIGLVALLVGVAVLSLWSTGSLRAEPSTRSLGAEQGLSVEIKALASEFRVTYSITLVNKGSAAVGNIFVAGKIPDTARFMETTATPKECGFKGEEQGSAIWLCSQVAAGASVGPLSYKVSIAEKEAGPAHAWVSWKSPSAGDAMSPEVPFDQVAIDLPKRGCTDCHSLRDPNTGAVTIAYEAMHRGGPNHPKLPFDTKVTTCLGCHKPGTGERENMGAVAPKMLRDIVHPVHLNSPSFTGTYKGNCFTCHNVDGEGRFTLLGEKLDKDFRGIPKSVPVPGIPPSELGR